MLKLEFDVGCVFMWSTILVALIALALLFWDVHYFIRTIWVIVYGRIFEDKKSPEDITTIYGLCTTNDLDLMFKHMNNARYVRDLDFARFHFYDRTGIYKEILKGKGNALQSASIMKYRRTMPLFTAYKITTKVLYWDEKSVYLEQQFISLRDGFIRAIAFSKQVIIGVSVPEIMAKLTKKDVSYRPEAPPELEHFVNLLETNSTRLRKRIKKIIIKFWLRFLIFICGCVVFNLLYELVL